MFPFGNKVVVVEKKKLKFVKACNKEKCPKCAVLFGQTIDGIFLNFIGSQTIQASPDVFVSAEV